MAIHQRLSACCALCQHAVCFCPQGRGSPLNIGAGTCHCHLKTSPRMEWVSGFINAMIKTLILGICPYENGLIIPIPIRWDPMGRHSIFEHGSAMATGLYVGWTFQFRIKPPHFSSTAEAFFNWEKSWDPAPLIGSIPAPESNHLPQWYESNQPSCHSVACCWKSVSDKRPNEAGGKGYVGGASMNFYLTWRMLDTLQSICRFVNIHKYSNV